MKVALDLHDFSVVNNRLDVLLKLKEIFPNFKVSLFTVPIDKKEDWGASLIRDDYLKDIKQCLDWMQIIPHGYRHNGSEMQSMDYYTFKELIPEIEKAFNNDGLPFVKGFVSPHWRWTEGVVRALDDMGYWGAIDRDKVQPCPRKFYKYNYLLNEPFYESPEPVLKLHGHVYGTRNDVGRCFDSLLKLPQDTQWHFVTDFLEESW